MVLLLLQKDNRSCVRSENFELCLTASQCRTAVGPVQFGPLLMDATLISHSPWQTALWLACVQFSLSRPGQRRADLIPDARDSLISLRMTDSFVIIVIVWQLAHISFWTVVFTAGSWSGIYEYEASSEFGRLFREEGYSIFTAPGSPAPHPPILS
ncbi:hypothetical protein C8Q69DRAFT_482297 [Paecilomyces variotii]|uniref:Uncharacterized protein n=1 Tax=Byssochlamys spectabilis TaxID=264951 RepID=A0A443HI88_BYSSP|nr:hypothetical protein C8Q69DRAFT_482297 [Paecilomyces variotii]RWQ91550.1 hypothetical protein C8Q69DRAFT_482297 [Paecilomyces variotii]